jgi:hypothetical protein
MISQAKKTFDKIDSADSVSLNPQPVPEKISRITSVAPSDNDLRFRLFRERNSALKSGFNYYEKSKELPEGIETGQTFSIQEETPNAQINIASNITTDYFEELRVKFQELISNPQVVAEIIDFLDKSNPDYIRELANNWTKYSSQIINLPRPINVERIKDFLTAKLDEELNKQGKLNKTVKSTIGETEINDIYNFFFDDKGFKPVDETNVLKKVFQSFFGKIMKIGELKEYVKFNLTPEGLTFFNSIKVSYEHMYRNTRTMDYKVFSNNAKAKLNANTPNVKNTLPYFKDELFNLIKNDITNELFDSYPRSDVKFQGSKTFITVESYIINEYPDVKNLEDLYNDFEQFFLRNDILPNTIKTNIDKITTAIDLDIYKNELIKIKTELSNNYDRDFIKLVSNGKYNIDELIKNIDQGMKYIQKRALEIGRAGLKPTPKPAPSSSSASTSSSAPSAPHILQLTDGTLSDAVLNSTFLPSDPQVMVKDYLNTMIIPQINKNILDRDKIKKLKDASKLNAILNPTEEAKVGIIDSKKYIENDFKEGKNLYILLLDFHNDIISLIRNILSSLPSSKASIFTSMDFAQKKNLLSVFREILITNVYMLKADNIKKLIGDNYMFIERDKTGKIIDSNRVNITNITLLRESLFNMSLIDLLDMLMIVHGTNFRSKGVPFEAEKKYFETKVRPQLKKLGIKTPKSVVDIINDIKLLTNNNLDDLKPVYGYGLGKDKKQNPNHHIINNKYYVDKSLLDNGLYELRYIKNKHLKNKPITMTNKQLADMVKKIIYSKEYTNNDIETLPKEQQYIVYKIMKDMDLDIPSNANFNNEFNMLLGQIQNGNTNEVIKQKFKRALSMAYDFGKITRHQMEKIKMDLNI